MNCRCWLSRVSVRALVHLAIATGGICMAMQAQTKPEASQAMTAKEKRFYCNTKALTPEQRAHHTQLTAKLFASHKAIRETEKGYEFQFNPSDVSLAELADWVAAESKCCSFFDFHIDLEQEGYLLCLRLTGADGAKAFIRSEFGVASK